MPRSGSQSGVTRRLPLYRTCLLSPQTVLSKEDSVWIHVLLSVFLKIDIETDVVPAFNQGSPEQLMISRVCGPSQGEASSEEFGQQPDPWAPEQLGSIEFSSSLSVATVTSDSFALFLGRYVYPLDSSTWIEYWPTGSTCPSCQRFLANLDEFTEDIFLNGCANA